MLLATLLLVASLGGRSLAFPPGIVLVPLDDRPVTLALPVMLGNIAGRPVIAPPRPLLGTYLRFGQPDRIIAWLNALPARDANNYVLSSDMLAYGGLVASRVPGPTFADAYFRLRELRVLKEEHPRAHLGVFGTIMRLAPTGVPSLGDAAGFFAAYPTWTYLQQYANLHDPLLPDEEALAARLRARIGEPVLDAYLQTRARNYGIDRLLLANVKRGTIDRLVLGQDDAGPVGLHVPEVNALQSALAQTDVMARASIEPGADELGMALVAAALARDARWVPRVAVIYSTPLGGEFQDPLEFAPIATTIDSLIALCGGVRVESHPDIILAVRVPNTGAALNSAFVRTLEGAVADGSSVALADLSFERSYPAQGRFSAALLSNRLASHLDAYAGWNTDANSVGTALAEAIAAGAGRRLGTYNALAHRTFTYMRFLDDVDFHVNVRPDLNRWLDLQGVSDHTYLVPDVAAATARRASALLWNDGVTTLAQLYPGLHIASMQLSLPWNRTFEIRIDVRLAPNI